MTPVLNASTENISGLAVCRSDGPSESRKNFAGVCWYEYVLVALFAAFMCLWRIEASSFGSGDQTIHAIVTQEMLRSGDWLHPTYLGSLYYHKPPLKMWLSAIPVWLFGESNFSYRVLDGVIGVVICLFVFVFASRQFASRAAGYFSVAALTGSYLFFYQHGVRTAVQDPFMIACLCIALTSAYSLVERVLDRKSDQSIALAEWRLALLGGIAVGAAGMSKGLGAFIIYPILGLYLVLRGEVMPFLRRGCPLVLTVIFLSVSPLTLYLLLQGDKFKKAVHVLLFAEGYVRAFRGFNAANKPLYYWYAIARECMVVPPSLLIIASCVAAALVVRARDRRWAFLLSWALAPVFFYSFMKTRLYWYIMPALPGMAMLVGACITTALQNLRTRYQGAGNRWDLISGALAVFVLSSVVLLIQYNGAVAQKFLFELWRSPQDDIVSFLKERPRSDGRPYRVVKYDLQPIAREEYLYWGMLGMKAEQGGESALIDRLQRGEIDFVLTNGTTFEKLRAHTPVKSYAKFRARENRRRWLYVVNYLPDLTLPYFRSP